MKEESPRDRGAKLAAFRAALELAAPPDGWPAPLAALWYLEKGDWESAHIRVQDDTSVNGAWVHALVHRIEGDGWNARYWYGRAGRAEGKGDFSEERQRILTEILQGP
jgi:hypothetical protein